MRSLALDTTIVDERYEVRRRIAVGSYAEVYEAADLGADDRPVILKALNTTLRETPDSDLELRLVEYFRNEARALVAVCHPNVVQLLGEGEGADATGRAFEYIALERLSGGDLLAHCRRRPLSIDRALYYFRQVCAALSEAHACGVIHRDVKPTNLLLTGDGRVIKVIDFGVAKTLASAEAEVTRVGVGLYAAPEHNPDGEAPADLDPLTPAADVYALAKTIFTAMAGRAPTEFKHRPIERLPGELQPHAWAAGLLEVLRHATAPRPADRFPSVLEFLEAFSAVASPRVARRASGGATSPVRRTEPFTRDLALDPSVPALDPGPALQASARPRQILIDLTPAAGVRVGMAFAEDLGAGVALPMVGVPGGAFVMGSPEEEPGRSSAEGPRRRVVVEPFALGRFPVTQAHWRAVALLPRVERELDPNPSRFRGVNRPVETVSWDDAVEFCRRLSKRAGRVYRLPSEAEWEYACRAGTTTPFSVGETLPATVANFDGNHPYGADFPGEYREETTVVGEVGGPNPFGVSDMHGNVWEWCADPWHETYDGAPADGRVWEQGGDAGLRVARGGSWFTVARLCRSACRAKLPRDLAGAYHGFRIVAAPAGGAAR